jgi:alanine-glyoxylate transaminase/serine-glyoxylate transaminase/serine-pyruvate transaminase
VRTVGFVHAETSTGAESDAGTLTGIAHEFGALRFCDAVTSLAGVPLLVDDGPLNFRFTQVHKNASHAFPDFPPVSYSDAVIDRVKAEKIKPRFKVGLWT